MSSAPVCRASRGPSLILSPSCDSRRLLLLPGAPFRPVLLHPPADRLPGSRRQRFLTPDRPGVGPAGVSRHDERYRQFVGVEGVTEIRKGTEQDVQLVHQLTNPERCATFREVEDVRRVYGHKRRDQFHERPAARPAAAGRSTAFMIWHAAHVDRWNMLGGRLEHRRWTGRLLWRRLPGGPTDPHRERDRDPAEQRPGDREEADGEGKRGRSQINALRPRVSVARVPLCTVRAVRARVYLCVEISRPEPASESEGPPLKTARRRPHRPGLSGRRMTPPAHTRIAIAAGLLARVTSESEPSLMPVGSSHP